MLIIGAKGFAKEVLEVLHQNQQINNLCFYDDVTPNFPDKLYDKFNVLKSENEAKAYFHSVDKKFTIGIGNPKLRKLMYDKFTKLGAEFTSVISNDAKIGSFGNSILEGANIQQGVIITSDVKIDKGVLINLNCTVGHDCNIGEFVEICPNVNISGNCKIGDYTFIGTSATVLPKINIGNNVIIAAGSVINKDVPDNVMVAGVPAVIKKHL